MDEKQPNTEHQNNQDVNNQEQDKIVQTDSIKLRKDSYGENFQLHLLEEYKMYVEMMDRISARRGQINTFYIRGCLKSG